MAWEDGLIGFGQQQPDLPSCVAMQQFAGSHSSLVASRRINQALLETNLKLA